MSIDGGSTVKYVYSRPEGTLTISPPGSATSKRYTRSYISVNLCWLHLIMIIGEARIVHWSNCNFICHFSYGVVLHTAMYTYVYLTAFTGCALSFFLLVHDTYLLQGLLCTNMGIYTTGIPVPRVGWMWCDSISNTYHRSQTFKVCVDRIFMHDYWTGTIVYIALITSKTSNIPNYEKVLLVWLICLCKIDVIDVNNFSMAGGSRWWVESRGGLCWRNMTTLKTMSERRRYTDHDNTCTCTCFIHVHILSYGVNRTWKQLSC